MALQIHFILILLFLAVPTLAEKNKVPLVQRAFISASRAPVYKEPDFDAPQLYQLSSKTIVLISTKIYRPPHLFGTFYKVFMKRPKKIRGYISEIDLIPEFKKKNNGYIINPDYIKQERLFKTIQKRNSIVRRKKSPDLKNNKKAEVQVENNKKAEVQVEDNKKSEVQVKNK